MSWSSGSANRIELTSARPAWRAAGVVLAAALGTAAVVGSQLPVATIGLLPLICWALWWRGTGSPGSILLLASNSDQLSVDEQSYTLHDYAVISASVGLRLEDSKGMRRSLLMGPWNSSAEDRRQLRLWLTRSASGSTR